ncbi:hypothetical protein GF352_02125 [archaeon]|nr:hypothetical protein [archaeon]
MNKTIKKITVIAAIILLAGCTGGEGTQTGGILLKNELSNDRMQPGGSVLLRTSVNNFFDNQLNNAWVKLTRSFGQLSVGENKLPLGDVQANPNATARTQWTLNVRQSASSGTVFTNKVRLCFTYEQLGWHEVALVKSFQQESTINTGAETGPLKISFAGLDSPYVKNDVVDSQIPISISIKNKYDGYVGTIDMSKDEIANLTYVEMRIYDSPGDNASPQHFDVLDAFTNPSCSGGQTSGCLECDNSLWDEELGYIKCQASDLSVFGDETFIGTKLGIKELETEELIQIVEVLVQYDYCIESEDFSLTVFTPGGG